MSFENPTQEKIFDYLKTAKTIAIVGLSNKEERTSYQIARFLQERGYRIIPVNPLLAGEIILGEKVYASLQEIQEPIDIVDIFRRSEFLPEVAADFLQTQAKVFWAQLGIANEETANKLQSANRKDIVMDRCIKIEWNNMNEKDN
ncbi:CoA-binding protein [Enterococcus hirae]|uniref:CoA-binding protein n=1 Tax=Enterococcus hirae TaxID=1354 RepID=UPI00370F36BA